MSVVSGDGDIVWCDIQIGNSFSCCELKGQYYIIVINVLLNFSLDVMLCDVSFMEKF